MRHLIKWTGVLFSDPCLEASALVVVLPKIFILIHPGRTKHHTHKLCIFTDRSICDFLKLFIR